MRPLNDRGTPVDPVPFLVVAALGFLVSYAYGPIYCMALGFTLPQALGLSTLAFGATLVTAYHRLVWIARPELRGEVPAGLRLRRLFLAALIVAGLLGLLALPLLAP